ncbi:MAG: beta-hydroxyacyl-ACP dehydratase [Planctomycetes bacterium]|nr:beta-hydroxyacyl-ACP dehydratase [Planctomycetota bacterium]
MSSPLIHKLPHRDPFLFVHAVHSVVAGAIEASWSVDGSEAFFRGHFPGNPVVPGVLIIEALAQAAGLVMIAHDPDRIRAGMLVQSDIRFRQPVRPPATIDLSATLEGSFEQVHRFNVKARDRGVVVAEGTLVLSITQS